MKKILCGATMILMCASACSSKDDGVKNPANDSKQATINVSPASLSLDDAAQTAELTVTGDTDWAISTDASWVTLRPSGGLKNQTTTVKVTVEQNKDFDSRSAVLEIKSGSAVIKSIPLEQGYVMNAIASVSSLTLGGQEGEAGFTVTANGAWQITCDADWITLSPAQGEKGDTDVSVKVSANETEETREAALTLVCGDSTSTITVSQLNSNIEIPEGYTLVWNDEFDYEGTPKSDWIIENQKAGWVNNELQTYTSKQIDGKSTLEVKDGFLHVNCFKGSDGKIYSGRMNAKPSTGWQYGYVEARINLPSGKGTWPAFWMMPSNVDWTNDPWPYCGEIDIMEEVGVVKNEVSSSIHTGNYNHTIGTQKTHAMTLPDAEGAFHVYAVEWDENMLTTYVDGKVQLKVTKAELGDDHASWPFDRAFYPILNLAWGGDWGGMQGVDENALPLTMLVDYVRIFQKK